MEPALKFLLVDDDAFVRVAIEKVVNKHYPEASVEMAGSVEETLSKLETDTCDFLILDLALGTQSGLAVVRQLRAAGRKTPVLILSARSEDEAGIAALRAGANGFLSKDFAIVSDRLMHAIRHILSGNKYLSEALTDKLIEGGISLENGILSSLSSQETKVFHYLASGNTIKEITYNMGVNEKTVRTYRSRLLEKLQLKSDTDVIRFAIQNGLNTKY